MPLGQTLADSLLGVDRPGLENAVQQAQYRNGLVSANTQVALANAQNLRDEADARAGLRDHALAFFGGNKARADFVADTMISKYGNAQQALDAVKTGQEVGLRDRLADPTTLGTPNATAAASGLSGKIPEPVQVHPEYTVAPGMPAPTVLQSPLGAAQTAAQQSNADLHTAQRQHPEQFHNVMGNLTPEEQQQVADFVEQNPGAPITRALISSGGAGVAGRLVKPPNADGTVPISLKAKSAIQQDFASGIAAKQTTALNTMINHAALFDAIADQLNNGNFTPTNYIANLWKRTTGSEVPTDLRTAGGFLGREAVRATVNSGSGTGAERELAVNENATPAALHGAAQTLRSLGAGQLHSLELRAKRGDVDISELLGPEAQKAFGISGHVPAVGASAPVAAPGVPPPAAPAPAGPALDLDAYLKSQRH